MTLTEVQSAISSPFRGIFNPRAFKDCVQAILTKLTALDTTIALFYPTAGKLLADIIDSTAATFITVNKALVRKNTATAINVTATVTAAQLAGGLLTTTSAAAVAMTLPTATELATALGAGKGDIFEFVVDNSAGANTVTVIVGAGITASDFPGTNTLTRTASATVGIATFRITFISTTAAILARIS